MKTKAKAKAKKVAKALGVVPAPVGEFQRIAVDEIAVVSNTRKTFNLDDLLPSIQERGIIQPLIVRPLAKAELKEPDLVSKEWRIHHGGTEGTEKTFTDEKEARKYFKGLPQVPYELVAGERRLRCAVELKLKEVPCMVRALSDAEAWAEQQIENLQRESLSPIEEAQGYQDAIDKRLYGENVVASVKAIAERVSKSTSQIYNRLSLLKLGESARQALSGGKLDLTIALLVASIPDPAKQQEALEQIRKPNHWSAEPMTFREAKAYVEEEFRRSLKGAPFDAEDAELVPEAGACAKCQFRMAPNVCTNTTCYEQKSAAAASNLAAKYVKKGRTVVSEKPDALFHRGGQHVKHDSGYVNASDTCYQDPQYRTYKVLLGNHTPPAIAFNHEHLPVEVYPSQGLHDLIRAAGHTFLDKKKAEKKQAKAEEQLQEAVNEELLKDLLRLVERDEMAVEEQHAFLSFVLDKLLWRGALSRIFKRRGMEDVETDETWYAQQTLGQLRSYIVEQALLGCDGGYDGAEEAAKMFDLAVPVIRNRVETRLKAEANADARDAKEKKGKK